MKRITLLITVLFLFFYFCKKTEFSPVENQLIKFENEITTRFFSLDGKVDPVTLIVLNEIN